MKLSELIAKYGDENVEFQNLDECMIDLWYNTKQGTTIKFGTTQDLDIEPVDGFESCKGTKKLGLVVWFDRDEVKRIMEEQ